jgi:hypothetical protein
MRPPQEPGSSSPAMRPRPQTCDCAGLVRVSLGPVATAPEVAAQTGDEIPRSARAWTRPRVAARPVATTGASFSGDSSAASRDSTPAITGIAAASGSAAVRVLLMRAARLPRSTSFAAASAISTRAPASVSASARAVTRSVSGFALATSSHVPESLAGAGSGSGVQPTR